MSFKLNIDDQSTAFLAAVEEIKVRLGFPVIEQNMDDSQISLLLKDALKFFSEKSYNGNFKKYFIVECNNEINNNGFNIFTLLSNPEDAQNPLEQYGGLYEITDIISNDTHFTDNIQNLANYQNLYGSSLYTFTNPVYKTDVAMFNMYNADNYIKHNFILNKQTGDITIQSNLKKIKYIILETYFYYTSNELLTHEWVIKYATALARIEWGKICGKYSNLVLAGGIQINSDRLVADGRYEKQELLEELRQDSNPLQMFFY